MTLQSDLPSMRQLRYFVALADSGQYRRAAIEAAIKENPELGEDTYAIGI